MLFRSQASQYELPRPNPRTFSLSNSDQVFDDKESTSFLSAKTRLGPESIRISLVPKELYGEVKSSTIINKELAKRALECSVTVSLVSVKDFLELEDVHGNKPIHGIGLLSDTAIFASDNDMCKYADGHCLYMNPELGFQITKEETNGI